MKKFGFIFAAAVAACVPHPAPVMSWLEYARRQVEWPYVLKIDARPGALLFFGSAHTYDPRDPQVARIEAAWSAFRPDIAFTEGSPRAYRTHDEAVTNGGEPALVRFLAARDNVPTTTLEPTRAEELAALSPRFTREQLKMFYILRDISEFAKRHSASEVEQEVARLLALYAETPGLSGAPRDRTEFEAAYARAFPGTPYQSVPAAWLDPVEHLTFLNEISRASGAYRDDSVVERLVHEVKQGRRVFAVMGGTHVVMQEPALRSRLR